eukprot:631485-Pelagomonas_calceolata.AAC.1
MDPSTFLPQIGKLPHLLDLRLPAVSALGARLMHVTHLKDLVHLVGAAPATTMCRLAAGRDLDTFLLAEVMRKSDLLLHLVLAWRQLDYVFVISRSSALIGQACTRSQEVESALTDGASFSALLHTCQRLEHIKCYACPTSGTTWASKSLKSLTVKRMPLLLLVTEILAATHSRALSSLQSIRISASGTDSTAPTSAAPHFISSQEGLHVDALRTEHEAGAVAGSLQQATCLSGCLPLGLNGTCLSLGYSTMLSAPPTPASLMIQALAPLAGSQLSHHVHALRLYKLAFAPGEMAKLANTFPCVKSLQLSRVAFPQGSSTLVEAVHHFEKRTLSNVKRSRANSCLSTVDDSACAHARSVLSLVQQALSCITLSFNLPLRRDLFACPPGQVEVIHVATQDLIIEQEVLAACIAAYYKPRLITISVALLTKVDEGEDGEAGEPENNVYIRSDVVARVQQMMGKWHGIAGTLSGQLAYM